MIGQHGRSVHEAIVIAYLWGTSSVYHHLQIISQSIKPTVERLSHILHESSISRDPHLLTSYTLRNMVDNLFGRQKPLGSEFIKAIALIPGSV